MSSAWLNGAIVEEFQAHIGLRDTGLLHAAGVFTTMRCTGGQVFGLAQHLNRLRHSCEVLFIPLQFSDEQLRGGVEELLKKNRLADARLRITVTRGAAHQDPMHGLHLEPTVFITAAELQPYPAEFYQNGMMAIVMDEQKLNPYDIQAGHKTLNYFSRLAGLREANRRSAGEAIWFDVHNYLQSGSISNVFLVKSGELLTPPTQGELQEKAVAETIPYPRSAVLPGIIRQAVMELARTAGITVKLAGLGIDDLLGAEEIFLTNSIMGVMPVCRIERHTIGNDKPGAMTVRIGAELDKLMRESAGRLE